MRILTLLLWLFFIVAAAYPVTSSIDVYRIRAIELLESGKYDQAVDILEKIKSSSKYKDVYFLLGLSYYKLGRYNEAINNFQAYEKTKATNTEFHYYLGISYFELDQHRRALEEFRKSELLGIKKEESKYYQGYIYFLQGNYKEAFPFFVNAIKEKGEYAALAHYYAGVCLYMEGLNNPSTFSGAKYHFEMVIYKGHKLSNEAKRYIRVIDEYFNSGIARYKKRWNLNAYANLLFSLDRRNAPLEGLPAVGVTMGDDSYSMTSMGDLKFKAAFSPYLTDYFGVFLVYGFATDLAFRPTYSITNSQGHIMGIAFQAFSPLRTWELGLEYHYSLDYIDQSKLSRLASANVIELGAEMSITKSWAVGLNIPMRFYSGIGGAWGDFTARSIEIGLLSYHIIGTASFRLEPSILFTSGDSDVFVSRYTSVGTKLILPWRIWFFWPSIKFRAGMLTNGEESGVAYKGGLVLFVPLGLGMKGTYSFIVQRGFLSQLLDFRSGIGFEYVF